MRSMTATRARPPSPLRRREFRYYFIGNTVSNVGTWLGNVALGVYMLTLTGSSFWVGVTGFGLFLPVLAFALPFGALADRVDRLRLLRAAQLLAGTLATILTVLVALDVANRYLVAAIAFGMGVTVAIGIPTMQSVLPHLVPPDEYPDALSLNALTFNLARVAGPIAAAASLVTLGAAWAFGLNAATFFVLAIMLSLIRRAPFPRPAQRAAGGVREGLGYAWRHTRTRSMLLSIVAIGVTLEPITTLSPALARDYGLRAGGAGWIVASWGGGAVLLILLGRPLIRTITHHGLGWTGLLALGVGMASLGAAPSLTFAVPAGLLAGAGYIAATMAFTTRIQQDVPEELRGRVSALWTMAFLAPRAFSAVAAGALADAIGPHRATAAFSIVSFVAALMLRHVEATEAEPVAPAA